MELIEESDSRFTIDNSGWRRMNAGRSASQLVREAVSNAFDVDNITSCRVTLNPGEVTIEDDGPGIGDHRLISSVFLTNKCENATKRGRKGRGSAELISAAEWAEVETVGFTITFAAGRKTETNARTKGTKVTVKVAAWAQPEIDECLSYLKRLMPPDTINFTINGQQYAGTPVHRTVERVSLETQIIVDGVQRNENRYTNVLIRDLRSGEKSGSLYEMGIPVQDIFTPYHVDVQQRVPMNDNRDVVSNYYKERIWTTLIDAVIDEMRKTQLSEPWAQVGARWASEATQKAYVSKLLGVGNIAITGDNRHANDKAKQDGYRLVDISTLPYEARCLIEAQLPTAEKVAQDADASAPYTTECELRDTYVLLVKLYEWIAKEVTGEVYNISFFSRPPKFTGVRTLADHIGNQIRFNILDTPFNFEQPLSPALLGTLVHELSHHWCDDHGTLFMDRQDEVAGMVAYILWSKRDEIETIMGDKVSKTSVGKLTPVKCQWEGCNEVRLVKPQDLHQVRFCRPHQKEAAKSRAKERHYAKNSDTAGY